MANTKKNRAGAPVGQPRQAWIDALVGNQGIDAAVAAGRTVANAAAANGGAAAATMIKLPELHVGSAIRWGNVEWFPVWTSAQVTGNRRYTTTRDPLAVNVKEKANAQVAGLQLENKSNQAVLLFEGEILDGGMQHRALTRTVFVPANAEVEIPVVCVEAGRWAGAHSQRFTSQFVSGKSAAFSSLPFSSMSTS